MEKSLKPDRKFYTASFLIHLTSTVSLILLIAVINLIINLTGGDPDAVYPAGIYHLEKPFLYRGRQGKHPPGNLCKPGN